MATEPSGMVVVGALIELRSRAEVASSTILIATF
jgi:hypothetical protein